jgi:hypothetical protein
VSEREIDIAMASFHAVLSRRQAIYCSAPVTSGRPYLQLLSSPGVDASESAVGTLRHRREVVDFNRHRAMAIVDSLRRTYPAPVIDPTALPAIGGWGQDVWLTLWTRVIGEFAQSTVFIDDWQYSFGCAAEYLFSSRNGIPTFDERGQPLAPESAASLLRHAGNEYAKARLDGRRLLEIAADLDRISTENIPYTASLTEYLRRDRSPA